MATPRGLTPTGMVVTTVLVAVSKTVTLFDKKAETYPNSPFGVIATSRGPVPTGMVATIRAFFKVGSPKSAPNH